MNHYDYLEKHLNNFINTINNDTLEYRGLISSCGDKCYQYKTRWEKADVPFNHGVLLYMLSRVHPFAEECRRTEKGYYAPCDWVIDNYSRFKSFLPE